MNTYMDKLIALRDALSDAIALQAQVDDLKVTIECQSKMIAALVMDNGEKIKTETWAKVQQRDGYCPYEMRSTDEGLLIRVWE